MLKSSIEFIKNGSKANRDKYSSSDISTIMMKHVLRTDSTSRFDLGLQDLNCGSNFKRYLYPIREKGEPYFIGHIL
jgi:hypothetical protein